MRREGIGSAGEMGQMVSPKERDGQYLQEDNVASRVNRVYLGLVYIDSLLAARGADR